LKKKSLQPPWLSDIHASLFDTSCAREIHAEIRLDLAGVPHGSLPFTEELKTIMAKTVCKVLGVVFLLVGCAGFAAPMLLGAHLTPPHNVVHIVSGVIALYFGFAGSLSGAKAFSLVFGVVYLALGILGMALGTGAEHMWHVGPLQFGQMDHGIHILLGVVFLAGGLFTKTA